MGTSFEHNFNYDLLMVHVFKATINQSYCKYNTSLRKPQDVRLGLVAQELFWFFKWNKYKPSSIQGGQMVLQIFNNKMHLTCIILFNHIQLKNNNNSNNNGSSRVCQETFFKYSHGPHHMEFFLQLTPLLTKR